MQPCYKWWEPPYFWAGLRMYDVIAGSKGLEWCRYLTPQQAGAVVGVAGGVGGSKCGKELEWCRCLMPSRRVGAMVRLAGGLPRA